MPYLGPVVGVYTDWTPVTDRAESLFPEELDHNDPWQFTNVLVREVPLEQAEAATLRKPRRRSAS